MLALPEALGAGGRALLAGDIAAAAFCILALGFFGGAAPTFLCVAMAIVIALAVGRYRISYALTPRDDLYQAAGVALLATGIAAVLALLLGLSWWFAFVAGLLWAALAGGLGIALARLRRGEQRFDPSTHGMGRSHARIATALQLSLIRVCDVILASLAIVFATPALLVIALAIAIRDRVSPLFTQQRVGRNETEFTLLKFRTMRANAGAAWAGPGDARITPLGAVLRRTSLDELPQLFNVIAGSMSLVGPRPEMCEYAERFARDLQGYSWRHAVRPGLTGWAQLHLPRNLQPNDMPHVLQFDLFYVENVCLYLYLSCLMKTACEIGTHQPV